MFQVTIFMQASMLFGRKAFDEADRIACVELYKGHPFAFLPSQATACAALLAPLASSG
jgi:hypothetical protein